MARFQTSYILHCNKPQIKNSPVSARVSKNKILHKIKFNQEIPSKLHTRMHQLSINLVCSSDHQTAESFHEIKHFVKQAKSL